MLQPSDRNHLFESLRPPADYTLDWAIGTTFTLDLLTLLTAPLAFTSFDWADEAGVLSRSPHSLLATMHEYAERIRIFCQTGMIALPKQHHLLFSYLENCIVEVDAPRQQGLFHPKIWVLRFTAPDQPVCYRLLCLSRNLTFDRSWDTILLLDGLLTDTEIPGNQPLSDFVGGLPQLAHSKTVSDTTQQAIARMQQELRRVDFQPPPGFHTLKFHPIGIPTRGEFPLTKPIDRLLILSPFVADGGLQKLAQFGQDNVLISRPASLDAIPLETLANFQLFQLSPYANPEEDDGEAAIEAEDAMAEAAALVGLHAKLYVADAGPDARIWTGSANATEAAFALNVEFLVELIGAKERFGIDALLAHPKNNEINFRSMLEPFTPPPEPIEIINDLEQLAAKVQGAIARLQFHAIVSPLEGDLEQYRLMLQVINPEQLQLSPDITVKCYPLGHADLAVPLTTPVASTFTFLPLSCEAVTSFLAFEIRSADGKQLLKSCVMNVPIEGIPENRRQQILRSLLKDKNQVLRLLMFLLADSRADAVELLAAMGLGNTAVVAESNGHDGYAPQFPLFEALVKALSHNPTQLDRIHHLVNDLRQLPEDEQLLPDEFEQIWGRCSVAG